MPREHSFHKKVDDTKILSSLIIKDIKTFCDDFSKAKEYIQTNPQAKFNFFKRYSFCGEYLSLIEMALHKDEDLLLVMLNHPCMALLDISQYQDELFLFTALTNIHLKNYIKKHFLPVEVKNTAPYYTELRGKLNLKYQFQHLSIKEYWRLFIDGNKQQRENGWLDFELREPGYLKGMIKGWEYIAEHLEAKLSATFIQMLHKKCTNQVKNMLNNTVCGIFRAYESPYQNLSLRVNSSLRGKLELMEAEDRAQHYQVEDEVIVSLSLSSMEIEKRLNDIIAHYYESLEMAQDPQMKFSILARLIQRLERLHPFMDGNTRLFSMLIVNKELINLGFSPVILDNPNRSVGFSHEEFCNEMIAGMETFKQCTQNSAHLGKVTEEMETSLSQPCYKRCEESHAFFMQFVESHSVNQEENGVLHQRPS